MINVMTHSSRKQIGDFGANNCNIPATHLYRCADSSRCMSKFLQISGRGGATHNTGTSFLPSACPPARILKVLYFVSFPQFCRQTILLLSLPKPKQKMKFCTAVTTITLFSGFLSPLTNAATGVYDYDHVDTWNAEFAGENGNCDGRKQSPIALETMDCTHYANYEMNPGDCTLDNMDFVINKNGVQMNWKPDLIGVCNQPFFKIPVDAISKDPQNFNGGDTYIHAQTHIHLSSEHTIDGKYFAAELHMVHLNADGSRASVLGTMIRPVLPYDNPTFEHFLKRWAEVREADGCDCTEHYTFDPEPNLKLDVYENMAGKDFYHYDGGLTTPGCDEIVWWNFNTEPWNISVRQFNIMADIILKYKPLGEPDADGLSQCADKPQTNASRGGSTSRPPQPLNGREVLKICSFS